MKYFYIYELLIDVNHMIELIPDWNLSTQTTFDLNTVFSKLLSNNFLRSFRPWMLICAQLCVLEEIQMKRLV